MEGHKGCKQGLLRKATNKTGEGKKKMEKSDKRLNEAGNTNDIMKRDT